jgi:predicted ATP-binding protein involved in virulence
MQIERIELRNFRAFEAFSQDFHPGINVLVGDNGTGKTALLDALVVGAGSFFLGVDDKPTPVIRPDDVRIVSREIGDTIEIRPQFPAVLALKGRVFERELEWSRSMEGKGRKTTYAGASRLKALVQERMAALSQGASESLPLIAYHGTGRLWKQRHTWGSTRRRRSSSRLDGYANCLDAASDEKSFLDWLKAMEWTEFQEGRTPSVLRAVRETIRGLVPGCTDLRYRAKEGQTIAVFEDGRRLPQRMLSDGFRTIVGLAADLAWRCATLNPQMGERAAEETPGIVMIDEIDLHLHPNWQRRIIDDLRRIFPRVQFFLTTHSPFIVQSLRAGEVVTLSGPAHLEKPPYKRGVEEVSTDVLGVKDVQRSERFREMEEAAREVVSLLERPEGSNGAEVARARDRYRDLVARYSDDPGFLAVLRAEGAIHGVRLDGSSASGAT